MITDVTLLINASTVCRKAEWYWKSKEGEEENAELVRVYNSLFDIVKDGVLDNERAAKILGVKPEDVEEALYKRGILVKKN